MTVLKALLAIVELAFRWGFSGGLSGIVFFAGRRSRKVSSILVSARSGTLTWFFVPTRRDLARLSRPKLRSAAIESQALAATVRTSTRANTVLEAVALHPSLAEQSFRHVPAVASHLRLRSPPTPSSRSGCQLRRAQAATDEIRLQRLIGRRDGKLRPFLSSPKI